MRSNFHFPNVLILTAASGGLTRFAFFPGQLSEQSLVLEPFDRKTSANGLSVIAGGRQPSAEYMMVPPESLYLLIGYQLFLLCNTVK
jgi:hypothetical protein